MANEVSSKNSLMAGGVAGLTSSVILQPFDLLKTRLQQQKQHNIHYNTTLLKEIRKLQNIKELWRGVLPSCLRTSIGSAIYLTLLSKSRVYLSSFKANNQELIQTSSILPRLSHMENLSIGFIVRAIAGYVTMPITIIKTRYESNLYNYNSMYESVEGIYFDNKVKGSVTNFFKGSFVTLSRDCPYAGLYVLFYESFKYDLFKLSQNIQGDVEYKAGAINSTAAVLAASVATTITAPFDAIKTRLQLSIQSQSILQVTKHLINEPGGARNLFRGLSLRLGRKGLSAGISWCIYEDLLKKL